MKNLVRYGRWRIVALIYILILAGCSEPEKSPEQQVRERAEARWQAMIARDFATAYEFELPSYREIYSLKSYRKRYEGSVDWTSAEIESVAFDGKDAATVTLEVAYVFNDPRMGRLEGQREISGKWIQKQGTWWHVLE